MREIDEAATPSREKAEKIAREHLAKAGLRAAVPAMAFESTGDVAATEDEEDDDEAEDVDSGDSLRDPPVAARLRTAERQTCASCGTSNEGDATFCKKCGASLAPASAEERDAAESAS